MARKRTKTKRRIPRRGQQLELEFKTHGGKRKGAGRKREAPRSMVEHETRPEMKPRFVALVTSRVFPKATSLRRRLLWDVIRRSILRGRERFGMRLVEFSVQGDHLHYLCEADDAKSLTRGMQGLTIRIAKGINKALDTRGSVFADRYHERVLQSPLAVRRALVYVLNNARKHVRDNQYPACWIDGLSSARWFRGWLYPFAASYPDERQRLPAEPTNWLLTQGWQRHGLIEICEVPRGGLALGE